MYDMENRNDNKTGRKDKIISLRMKREDYLALQNISKNKRSDVSKIIRIILETILEMIKENNSKSNSI
jgi:predicted DNA-binding protein